MNTGTRRETILLLIRSVYFVTRAVMKIERERENEKRVTMW